VRVIVGCAPNVATIRSVEDFDALYGKGYDPEMRNAVEFVLAQSRGPLKVVLANPDHKESRNMHYRNGREAKNGDKVVKLDMSGKGRVVAFGVLHDATPGNDYCNGSIAPIVNDTGACICDMLHVDDLAALIKQAGLDTRPPAK